MDDQFLWQKGKVILRCRFRHLWYFKLISHHYSPESAPKNLNFYTLFKLSPKEKALSQLKKQKTILIGNLSMGGSGKTEVSRYLAEQLPGSPLVISKNIAGSQDEINFLRSKDIKVSSFKNIQSKEIKIFDDSLHSKKKKEGLNILCARADLPIGNGYLAPFGPLRINKFLPKIDLIWFTHCGTKTPTWSTKNHGERSIYSRYIFCEKSMEKLNQIPKHSRVGVFTGIADPQRFCNLILSFRSDLKIFLVPFPDHFRFQKSDWDFIQKVAQEDKIPHWLCTQKDFFRLQRDPIPTELMKTSFALELKLELDLQSQKVFEEFFR